jgi:hypothetical protein
MKSLFCYSFKLVKKPVSLMQEDIFIDNYFLAKESNGELLFANDGSFSYILFDDELSLITPANLFYHDRDYSLN